MKRLFLLVFLLIVQPLALRAADDDAFGSLTGAHYQNRMYGFALDIPQGWQVAKKEVWERMKASISGKDVVFLVLEHEGDSNDAVIVVKGEKFSGTPSVSARKVKGYSEELARRTNGRLLKGPYLVNVGGIDMFRSDLQTSGTGGNAYRSVMAVGIRDRILVAQALSSSQESAEEAARTLASAIKFEPDFSLPKDKLDTSQPVVVASSGVMDGLAQKNVQPRLSDEARKAHARGRVMLRADISRQGIVQRLWIVDFDETLSTPSREPALWNGWLSGAAVQAVRQWTYKPYLVNGKPSRVDTHIIVDFE